MCKGSAELTYWKTSCEWFPPSAWDELWEELYNCIWCLHVGHNILCAFPKCWLAANLMSSHFWDVESFLTILRFQLENNPTVCYVLSHHMWHIALLEAHCPACAQCSFPNRAGKVLWVCNSHKNCSSHLPQWRERTVEKCGSFQYQMLYHHLCHLLLVRGGMVSTDCETSENIQLAYCLSSWARNTHVNTLHFTL